MEQIIRAGHLTAQGAREVLDGISAGALRNLVYRGQLTRRGGTERYPHFSRAEVYAIAVKRRQRAAA